MSALKMPSRGELEAFVAFCSKKADHEKSDGWYDEAAIWNARAAFLRDLAECEVVEGFIDNVSGSKPTDAYVLWLQRGAQGLAELPALLLVARERGEG